MWWVIIQIGVRWDSLKSERNINNKRMPTTYRITQKMEFLYL